MLHAQTLGRNLTVRGKFTQLPVNLDFRSSVGSIPSFLVLPEPRDCHVFALEMGAAEDTAPGVQGRQAGECPVGWEGLTGVQCHECTGIHPPVT